MRSTDEKDSTTQLDLDEPVFDRESPSAVTVGQRAFRGGPLKQNFQWRWFSNVCLINDEQFVNWKVSVSPSN